MKTFNSKACSVAQAGYEGLFQHDRGTRTIVVKDPLVTNETIARARARSELLKGGYAERWITFSTIHIAGLKQNDIIVFKGLRWIIKEISLSFTAPVLSCTIKGLRYE